MNPLRAWLRRRRYELSWLTSDIAIAAEPSSGDWPALRAAGLSAVLDMRAESDGNAVQAERYGIGYLRLPVVEGDAPSDDELRLATDWVLARMAQGPVLVHCREGRGRSAMVACAALVKLGLPLTEAYAALRRARPNVALSSQQADSLERFADRSRQGSL